MAVVGRRSVVVAASAGLVVSTFGAPAIAAPSTNENSATLGAVDTSALTASARAALDTAPVVVVGADATWSFDAPNVTVVADPKPVTKAATRRAAAASRSAARVAAAVPSDGASIPQSVAGNAVLEIAARYVGVPYRSGGRTPEGFDCSGFTSYVFAQVGISLAASSSGQRSAGTIVSRADALPGDLIWSPGHVAIYAGGNTEIDAPRPGKSIQFRSIWQGSPTFIRIG